MENIPNPNPFREVGDTLVVLLSSGTLANGERNLMCFTAIPSSETDFSQKITRCGGPTCKICSIKANEGCMLCEDDSMTKFFEYPVGSKALYAGCSNEVSKSSIQCDRKTSIQCFK